MGGTPVLGFPTGLSVPHFQDPESTMLARYVWHPESRKSGFASIPGGISLLSLINRILESEEHMRSRAFGGNDTAIKGFMFPWRRRIMRFKPGRPPRGPRRIMKGEDPIYPPREYPAKGEIRRMPGQERYPAVIVFGQRRPGKPPKLHVYPTRELTPEEFREVPEKRAAMAEMDRWFKAATIRNPAALAAWLGRRKYGHREFQRRAESARRRASEARREADRRRAASIVETTRRR